MFVLLKVACLVTLLDRQLRGIQNSPKWAIFKELLSTQNTNVAGKFECDFFFLWFSNSPTLMASGKYDMSTHL